MVDLTKLKAGDTVKFRCGGEAVVNIITDDEKAFFNCPFGILFEGMGIHLQPATYTKNGKMYSSLSTPFDIVEITPVRFNWDDIKVGMCFHWEGSPDKTAYFIAKDGKDNLFSWCIFGADGRGGKAIVYGLLCQSVLTRAPEHDLGETQ